METWPFGASPTSILSTERSAILAKLPLSLCIHIAGWPDLQELNQYSA